jgi:hypothetical protein
VADRTTTPPPPPGPKYVTVAELRRHAARLLAHLERYRNDELLAVDDLPVLQGLPLCPACQNYRILDGGPICTPCRCR